MPPRHAYWTIIVDDQPTSFRAHDVEELLPTFNRLREKHPNTQLRWFERGQLFESRDAAREAGGGRGERRWEGPRPERRDEGRGSVGFSQRPERPDDRGDREPPRDRKWRPGGEHRDPRQKYKDAKKAKWQRYKQQLRARHDERLERPVRDDGEFTPPHGDPLGPKPRPEWRRDDRPRGPKPQWRRDDRPRGAKPQWKREREQPEDRSRDFRRDDRDMRPAKDRPRTGDRKPWGSKPEARGKRPWGAKPGGGFRKKPFGSSGPRRNARAPKKRRDDE